MMSSVYQVHVPGFAKHSTFRWNLPHTPFLSVFLHLPWMTWRIVAELTSVLHLKWHMTLPLSSYIMCDLVSSQTEPTPPHPSSLVCVEPSHQVPVDAFVSYVDNTAKEKLIEQYQVSGRLGCG